MIAPFALANLASCVPAPRLAVGRIALPPAAHGIAVAASEYANGAIVEARLDGLAINASEVLGPPPWDLPTLSDVLLDALNHPRFTGGIERRVLIAADSRLSSADLARLVEVAAWNKARADLLVDGVPAEASVDSDSREEAVADAKLVLTQDEMWLEINDCLPPGPEEIFPNCLQWDFERLDPATAVTELRGALGGTAGVILNFTQPETAGTIVAFADAFRGLCLGVALVPTWRLGTAAPGTATPTAGGRQTWRWDDDLTVLPIASISYDQVYVAAACRPADPGSG